MSSRGPESPSFDFGPEVGPDSPEVAPTECLLDRLSKTTEAARKAVISCVSCDSCGQQYNSASSLPVSVQVSCPR